MAPFLVLESQLIWVVTSHFFISWIAFYYFDKEVRALLSSTWKERRENKTTKKIETTMGQKLQHLFSVQNYATKAAK
jgi:hypothetical protein